MTVMSPLVAVEQVKCVGMLKLTIDTILYFYVYLMNFYCELLTQG